MGPISPWHGPVCVCGVWGGGGRDWSRSSRDNVLFFLIYFFLFVLFSAWNVSSFFLAHLGADIWRLVGALHMSVFRRMYACVSCIPAPCCVPRMHVPSCVTWHTFGKKDKDGGISRVHARSCVRRMHVHMYHVSRAARGWQAG